MNLKKIVGENIKKIRESRGISQGDLAKSMGIDRSYVSGLESGQRNLSLESLEKMATSLSVEPIRLLEQTSLVDFNEMPIVTGLAMKSVSRWNDKKWYHQRFDGAPYLIHMIAEAEITVRRKEKGKLAFNQHFCFFEEGKADWYIDMDEIEQVTNEMILLGKTDPLIGENLIKKWLTAEETFYNKCDEIKNQNLRSLSDARLIALHNEFVNIILDRNSSSSIIDGFALGTDRLLEEKVKKSFEVSSLKSQKSFVEVFAKLTAPSHLSFLRQAEIALMELILKIKDDKSGNKRKYIEEYRDRFFWIRNNYVDANVLTVDYFEQEISQLQASTLNVASELNSLKEEIATSKKEKEELLKLLQLDAETLMLLKTTEEFTFWQDERKKATMFTAHYALLLLSEIAARTQVPFELIKYLSPREVGKIFEVQPNLENLKQRKHLSVMYWSEEGHETIVGVKVNEIKKKLLGEGQQLDIKDFRGLTASLGKVSGKVRVLKSVKDIGTLIEGEVLVAVMTRPDYVPAMKKACAIVTDEGGITSHAAIVSRELKIPCVIGTKIATQILKDGDQVEVNANHGLIKIIERIS